MRGAPKLDLAGEAVNAGTDGNELQKSVVVTPKGVPPLGQV